MTQSNDSQATISNDELQRMSPMKVHNTESLQARILQQTSTMQQNSDAHNGGQTNVSFLTTNMSIIKPLAIAASIALFAVLIAPGFMGGSIGSSSSVTLAETSSESIQEDELSLTDIEFEEVMLLSDELMFANL